MNGLVFDYRSDCYVWGSPSNGFGIHIVQTNPIRWGGFVVKNKIITEMPSSPSLEEAYDQFIKTFQE